MHFQAWARRLARAFSVESLCARLMSIEKTADSSVGLIMIQIDGLSRAQMERALESGRMPYLKKLHESGYQIHSHYSGLPSSTPAVQAELFYGIKCAVPGFGFKHSESGKICSMLSAKTAMAIERELIAQAGDGLLKGGSAYVDTFTGGAQRTPFCVPALGCNRLFGTKPFTLALILVLQWFTVAKALALFTMEIVLSTIDVVRGLIGRQNLRAELNFVYARVGISVLLRELIVAGARIDIARGVRIIHCNFLGYDEQSHRRGPSSRFAHWALKGIDDSIRRIHEFADTDAPRNYQVWVYSDHGQEHTTAFDAKRKTAVHSAVARAVHNVEKRSGQAIRPDRDKSHLSNSKKNLQEIVMNLLRYARMRRAEPVSSTVETPVVTAVGPLAHVYFTNKPTIYELRCYAREFIDKEGIPTVLALDKAGRAHAWNKHGEFELPEEIGAIVGRRHPFLEEVGEDLVALMNHRDAGALVLLGWRPDGEPISFPIESGAHAGPGREETHAFLLLPSSAPLKYPERTYARPLDLRNAVLRYFA